LEDQKKSLETDKQKTLLAQKNNVRTYPQTILAAKQSSFIVNNGQNHLSGMSWLQQQQLHQQLQQQQLINAAEFPSISMLSSNNLKNGFDYQNNVIFY
jgi:hypothetical protein